MKVDGKAAIVTGGGTGVGRATALDLAERGCSVLINYSKSRDEAEATAADITKLGVKGVAIQADVRDDAACRAMVERAVSEFGHLHILVNNAGATSFIPHDNLEGVRDEDWDKILSTNLKGPFQCSRAAKAAMEESGGGEIVNISSVAGVAAVGSSIPYCASKGALNNLTVSLARVMAPKIRVNAIAPGFISGRWLKAGLGDQYEAAMEATKKKVPLQAVCDPEDVAAAVVSIITGSDLVTGQIVVCDGGMLIARP